MKRQSASLIICFAALLLFIVTATGYQHLEASPKALPFKPGEKLVYRAKWRFLPAGEATIEVLPFTVKGGIKAYHFAMTTKTNASVDLIYKVRDRQDSYTDVSLTRTLSYTKKTGGPHPRDVIVTFDWGGMTASYANFGKAERLVSILPGTFDPLALFFIIRTQKIKKGDVLEIPITDGKKCIVIKASVVGRESLIIDNKIFDTYLVIPDMERLEGIVKNEANPKLKIWFSADQKMLPVKIQSHVAVGNFVFELISASF